MKWFQRAFKMATARKGWQSRALIFMVAVLVAPLLEPIAAHAATLTSTSFTVMDPRTNIPGNRYDWGFTTATTSTLSRVTMGMPAGTTGANRYLALNGVNNNYASTPSSSANFPSGDIDIKTRFSLATFPPAASTPLLGKDSDYRLSVTTNGNLQFVWVDSSGTTATMVSNGPLPITPNSALWLRAAFTVGGGSSHSTNFYTSTDGTNWVQFGVAITASSTSSTPNTNVSTLSIGARSDGTTAAPGKIYFASLANVINGSTSSPTSCGAPNVTQCFNPNNDTIAGTSWAAADTTAETWTVNRGGSNLPADIASDLSVMNISGLPAGGTAQNREINGTAAYVFPTATSVPASTAVSIGLAGFTNTYTANSYTSAITTYDNSATPVSVDTATTASVAITAPTVSTYTGANGLLSTSTPSAITSEDMSPQSIAVTSSNVYITDPHSNSIISVNKSNGQAIRIAGNGATNNGTDGTATTNQYSNIIYGVASDGSTGVYTADGSSRVRKIDTSANTIATIAGVNAVTTANGDGTATTHNLNNAQGVAFYGSTLWIVDTGHCTIRTVVSGTMTTVAGSGTCGFADGSGTSAQFNSPSDITFDSSGNAYVADTGNNRIRKIDTSFNVTTVAGTGTSSFSGDGGQATSATLSAPYGVAIDNSGNLLIADTSNNRIRKVVLSTGIISTIAGTGTASYTGDGGNATAATMYYPRYVRTDSSGNIFFVDYRNYVVRQFTDGGTISTFGGSGRGPSAGDGGAITNADTGQIYGLNPAGSNGLLFTDNTNYALRKIDQWGTVTKVAGTDVFQTGCSSADGVAATSACISNLHGAAVGSDGLVYIADASQGKLRKIDGSGNIQTVSSSYNSGGSAIALNPIDGNIYFADNCAIFKVTPAGSSTLFAGTDGTCGFGGDGGSATAGAAAFNTIKQLAFDSVGDLLIADSANLRIRMVDTSGMLSTVAGGGASGSDNVAATSEVFSAAKSVAVDALDNVYVAISTGTVKRFRIGGPITTVVSLPGTSLSEGLAIVSGQLYISQWVTSSLLRVNLAPVTPLVNNDQMSVPMNSTRPWPILSNDWSQSYEMDPSSVTVTNAPAHGTVTLSVPSTESSTMQANYTPTTSYTGSDSYTYRACDTTRVLCNTATVNITVSSNQVTSIASGPAEGYASQIGFTPTGGARFRNYIFYTDSFLGLLRRYDIYSKQSVVVAGNEIPNSSDGVGTAAGLPNPLGVAIAPDGTIQIAISSAGKVRTLSTNGALTTLSTGLTGISSVAFGRDGSLYETQTGYVKKWNGSSFVAFAGTGTAGGTGNNGPATSALVNTPYGIAGTANGDIYFSDSTDCTVRKVNTSGIISAVAGTSGTCTASGNSGAATSAGLANPKGIAFDSNGSLLIATSYAIRSVDTSGTISSVVTGLSVQTPTGIVAGTSTDFYLFDPSLVRGYYISTSGTNTPLFGNGYGNYSGDGTNPFAIDVTTGQSASGAVVDTLGNLYFSEPTSNVIRKMNLSTGAITTIVTGYSAQAITVDSNNLLVFADFSGCKVWRQNADLSLTVLVGTGTCSTLGDTGLATAATINHPTGVTYDGSGNLYIAEYNSSVIRKVSTSGYISTIAGIAGTSAYSGDGGPATSAALNGPSQIAFDRNGNLLIADFNNYRIRMVDRSGKIMTIAGTGTQTFSGDGSAAATAGIGSVRGIAVDANNNIFISDTSNNRVREISTNAGVINTVVGNSSSTFVDNAAYTTAGLNYQGPITFDQSGNLFFVESNNRRIREAAALGATATDNLSTTKWTVSLPNTGHLNLRENFTVTPAATSTSSKMTFTMPTSVAGTSLTVASKYGVTGAATAVLSGTTLTISYPSQTFTAGIPIGFAIEGWTNGGANGAYASYVTEYDSAGSTPVGWAHSTIVNITSSGAPTATDAGFASVWQRSLTTTSSASSVSVPVNPSATADNTGGFTVSTNGNLTTNGMSAAGTALTSPAGTLLPVTTDSTTSVASASFTTNRWGVQIASTTGTNAGATGSGLYSGLAPTLASVVTGASTVNTTTFTTRAKVNYLTPAGTYTSTLTWGLTPGV